MTAPLEYLLWSPDRETFIATMLALTLPDGQHIATEAKGELPDGGSVAFIPDIRCSEIGEITKSDGEVVPGYHVNMVAVGSLADMLHANGGWTAIFSLLGKMDAVQPEDGVPAGWKGTSGVKIYPPNNVNQRVRIWA
mgnify:CR=1 FL=1